MRHSNSTMVLQHLALTTSAVWHPCGSTFVAGSIAFDSGLRLPSVEPPSSHFLRSRDLPHRLHREGRWAIRTGREIPARSQNTACTGTGDGDHPRRTSRNSPALTAGSATMRRELRDPEAARRRVARTMNYVVGAEPRLQFDLHGLPSRSSVHVDWWLPPANAMTSCGRDLAAWRARAAAQEYAGGRGAHR